MDRTPGLSLKGHERVPKGTSREESNRYWAEVSGESGVAETSREVEGGEAGVGLRKPSC